MEEVEDTTLDTTELTPVISIDVVLKSAVLSILEKSDVNTLSLRQIREELENDMGLDVEGKKDFIRGIVEEFVSKITEQDEDKEEGSEGKVDEEEGALTKRGTKARRSGKNSAQDINYY